MKRPTSCAIGLLAVTALAGAPAGGAEAVPAPPPLTETVNAVAPPGDLPFDPAGRRDPFRPPKASAALHSGEARTPLQRYEIGQLKLVAIIYNTGQPRAVVEDDQGLGYIVKVGTPIGPNEGSVHSIERGRVVIKEDSVDYYGEHHPAEVVMDLRTAERGKQ